MPLLAAPQGGHVLYGIDVASYQGNVDWKAAYRFGIRFGFSKVTEGTRYLNPTWHHNLAGMTNLGSGFVPGAYHFLARGDAVAQARYFVQAVGGPATCRRLMIALDVEPASSRPTAGDAKTWVAEFRRLVPGHPVIGYVPGWYHTQLGHPDLTFLDTLWQSNYVTGSGTPAALYGKTTRAQWSGYGGRAVSLLQYSSKGSVTGVAGRCDVNAYRGTVAQLRALALEGMEDDVAAKDVWSYELPQTKDFPSEWQAGTHLRHLTVKVGQLQTQLAALAKNTGVEIDEKALAADLVQALSVETLAELIKTGLAADVVDELKSRL